MSYFTLNTTQSITPSTGEDVGNLLANSALARIAEIDGWETNGKYARINAAQLLFLAADAYDNGAAVSLGHGRSQRYTNIARSLRRQAEDIVTAARAAD